MKEGRMEKNLVTYNRTLIVGVLLAAAFVALLNQTLLIVALPPVMAEFHIEASQAQWITTAFLLTSGVMVPITAFLIEKFKSKSLLISALSIFAFGTLLGAIAPSFEILVTARVVQAMGAGILMPLMQTVLLTVYPPEKRGAAMGMSGLVIGFAPAIGPTLGGFIIDQFEWRFLFYIVLPITIIVLLASIILMKNVTTQKAVRLDILSVIFSSFGWGGLLYSFSIVGTVGWTDLEFIVALIVGIISLILFIVRQNKLERPMLSFKVFRSKQFTITTFLGVFMFGVMIGVETILPLYIQNVRSGTALQSGMMLLPGAILMGIMSPITGKLFDKYGAKGISITGFSFVLLAGICYLQIDISTSFLFIGFSFMMMMFGTSLLMTPLMTAGINALSYDLIPHGAAMGNTIRTVGASILTALIVSVMGSFTKRSAAATEGAMLLDGMYAAFIVIVILGALGVLLSISIEKKASNKAFGGE